MASGKREHRETISVDISGKTYSGTLVLQGTRKVTVCVIYNGKEEQDSRTWEPHETNNMKVMGEAKLIQMVFDEHPELNVP